MTSLDTSPISVTVAGGVVDLISGASLSGLTGAASPSPKVRVKGISTNVQGGSFTHTLTLYKGASGGSDPSTQIFQTGAPGQLNAALDVILEAGEVLTAEATSSGGTASPFIVLVSADIAF